MAQNTGSIDRERLREILSVINAETEKTRVAKQRIEYFYKKIEQAIRLRLRIVNKRNELISEYEKGTGDRKSVLKKLGYCLRKDRWLVGILEEGTKEGIRILKLLKSTLKKLETKEEILEEINRLAEFLKWVKKRFSSIKRRVAEEGVEEKFIEAGGDRYFSKFKKTWMQELEKDREIRPRLNGVFESNTYQILNRFADSLTLDNIIKAQKGAIGGALGGGMLGIGIGLIGMMTRNQELAVRFGTLGLAIGATLGAIFGIFMMLDFYEKELANSQQVAQELAS